MTTAVSIQCVNCGTALAPAPDETSVECPVCHFINDVSAAPQSLMTNRTTLEHSLGDLIAQARAGGLTNEEIVETLRDELEFAAELTFAGRNMCVQIIDLGPQESQLTRQPARNRSALLRGRAIGN